MKVKIIKESLEDTYNYLKKIYLQAKKDFEEKGEEDNNDVLSREDKMWIAKGKMDEFKEKMSEDVESLTEAPDSAVKLSEPIEYDDHVDIKINGKPYSYTLKDDSKYSIRQVVDKVNQMKKFSHGRALQFLKSNMTGTRVEDL